MIGRLFGDSVRGKAPAWSTTFAATLTCAYDELTPTHQTTGADFVTIQFRESQRFTVPSGWSFVGGLGICIVRTSCPTSHEPAWLQTTIGYTPGPNSYAYNSSVILRVEDGTNAIQITINDPVKPLLADPVAQAESLARKLLSRFRWP
jgi:hypothetical protein